MALVAAAHLDLTPSRRFARTELATSIWGDGDPKRAAANLRETLARTRMWERQTGLTVFREDGRMLIRDAETITSDLAVFRSLSSPASAASLRLLLELYAGDFLADVDAANDSLDTWVQDQRVALRDRFVRLALEGARQVAGDIGDQAIERIEQEAPYDDEVARQAMIAAAARSASGARATFERFASRLRIELGAEPEQATRDLLIELVPDIHPLAAAPLETARRGQLASLESVPRVLILPPAQYESGYSDGALVDAMMDQVTLALCRAKTFAVFAPHTARQLVRTPFPGGNPYGADYLVRTVFSAPDDDTASLSVSLTSLSTHEVLLGETLPVARVDLNSKQVHLANAIASRLASSVERSERRYYRATGSASAYVHFLLGEDDIRTLELRSLRRAKGHFRQAIRLSPNFVPARAMLARSLCLEWLLLDRKDAEPVREALRLANDAIGIDPSDPLAQREVGHALLYLDRFDEGLDALRMATDLGPHHADILLNYADGLIHIGEHSEARVVMDRALALNPLAPDQYHWISATADYMLGRYDAASKSFRRMKEREAAARFIAAVEAMNGNLEEAHRQRDIFLASHPDFRLAEYMVPQRRAEDRVHYLEGLRRAGFR